MSQHQPRTGARFLLLHHHRPPIRRSKSSIDKEKKKKVKKMCLLQCCYSCHLKVILDRMVPSCLQLQDPRQSERLSLAAAAAGAEARQVTLEEMLYPPPSWEAEAAATPLRRSSPKVCPVKLADLFSDEEEEADYRSGGGGGYSPPGVNESVSVSVVSRASLQSLQHSVSRRVSFRSPDEFDVFIIPARSYSDDDDEWSSDGDEPSRT